LTASPEPAASGQIEALIAKLAPVPEPSQELAEAV
jgi:hypothetical protein